MKRRSFIQLSGATLGFMGLPLSVQAADANDMRLFVVLCRGGLDGLAACQPTDSEIKNLRDRTFVKSGKSITGSFQLHPALSFMGKQWDEGHLTVVHAAGFGYDGRSHFDGQNLMESGGTVPYDIGTGWAGRALEELSGRSSIALSLPTPLVLRSLAPTDNLYPSSLPEAGASKSLVASLWQDDPKLALFGEKIGKSGGGNGDGMFQTRRPTGTNPSVLAREAARQMSNPDGPRVGFVEFTGFDTHSNQGAENGEQARYLSRVDDIFMSYASFSAELWSKTVIVTVSEFGRTAKENGTAGTDHGYASCIFISGGAVRKSEVVTDWPGLSSRKLYQGRDLDQTVDARDVYGQVLKYVFNLNASQLTEKVFPGSKQQLVIEGLQKA